MAPVVSNGRRRPRRRPTPAAATLPRDRLPVGTPRSAADSSLSHIRIVSRPSQENLSHFGLEESNIPVRTNPSYLSEVDPGLDLHHRDSHQRHYSGTTFADMARAGVGPGRDTSAGGYMASQEPQSLSSYVKFKKPRIVKGGRGWTPIDEEDESTDSSQTDRADEILSRQTQDMSITSSPEATFRRPNVQLGQAQQPPKASARLHPVALLQAHLETVPRTFGRQLPGPEYLRSTPGQREGEVQFTLHPNGDILASQWLLQSFQWESIGLYSFTRKKVEGVLSLEQLKGQKIGSLMPRNTLEYFIAIAKQFEESSIAKALEPKGYETGTAQTRVRPAIPLTTPYPKRPSLALDMSGDLSRSFSSSEFPSQQSNVPFTGFGTPQLDMHVSQFRDDSSKKEELFTQHSPVSSSLTNVSMDNISPLSHRPNISPEVMKLASSNQKPLEVTKLDLTGHLDNRVAPSKSLMTDSRNPGGASQKPFFSSGDSPESTGQQLREQKREQVRHSIFGPQSYVVHETDESAEDEEEEEEVEEEVSPKTTRTMKAEVMGHFFASLESSKPPKPMETPEIHSVHASMQSASHFGYSLSKQAPRNSLDSRALQPINTNTAAGAPVLNTPQYTPQHQSRHSTQYSRPPLLAITARTSSESLETRATLLQSDPENGYRDRQVKVVNRGGMSNLSHEEVSRCSRPTTQNWDGPFFTDPEEATKGVAPLVEMTEEEKLDRWWTSETFVQRQKTVLHSYEKGQMGLSDERKSFANGVERILYSVKENLMSYTEDPAYSKRDYFSKFAPPPAHSINNTPRGSQSFFDESYRRAPRFGQDIRYQNRVPSMGFDEQMIRQRSSFGGIMTSRVFPTSPNFGLGL